MHSTPRRLQLELTAAAAVAAALLATVAAAATGVAAATVAAASAAAAAATLRDACKYSTSRDSWHVEASNHHFQFKS